MTKPNAKLPEEKKIQAVGLSCQPGVNPGRPIDLKGQFIQESRGR